MKYLLAASLLVLVSAPADAQAMRQTLQDAVQTALGTNPTVLSENKARAVAKENLTQAKGAMLPTLGFTSTYAYSDDEPSRPFALPGGGTSPPDGTYKRDFFGLESRYSLFDGGRLTSQRDQARAGVVAATAKLDSVKQQLVLDVATAFIGVLYSDDEVAIREAGVSALSKQFDSANARFDVREVTVTDVAQARARLAASEADRAAAEARRAVARANFERLVGRPGIQLSPVPPLPALPESLETAIQMAMKDNPDLASLRANAEAARKAVGVAEGQLRPNLEIVGNAGIADTFFDSSFRDRTSSVTARLTIPFFQGGQGSSRIRSAQYRADAARLDTIAQERLVTARTTSIWYSLIAARKSIEASRVRVEAAQAALDGANQELAIGTRLTIDVLDQEREVLDARLNLLDAQRSEFTSVMQLYQALGRLGPELFPQ